MQSAQLGPAVVRVKMNMRMSLIPLLMAFVLFVGKAFAAVTITLPVTPPTQLQNFLISYSSSNVNAFYYVVQVNGVTVSPANYTSLSLNYLVQCTDFGQLSITVTAEDNTHTPIIGETLTVLSAAVVYSSSCPVAYATIVGAASNVVPVKSSQVIGVTSQTALSSVNVFFNGVFVCTLSNLVPGVQQTCPPYLIPCAALGSNVPLEITAVYPNLSTAPSPPVSYWTVDWVAGQCTAQLILLNLNGTDPLVTPTNCLQFGLQLDPTDDPTLYYNFSIEAAFPGAANDTNILNACMLDLSAAGEAIASANQSAFLIGSWKVPCSLNLAGTINFLAIFSRKTVGAPYVETLSSSTSADIGENAVCEVVFPYPTVTRAACAGNAVVMDAAGAYLQQVIIGDVLTFDVKIGDAPNMTYTNFELQIVASGITNIVLFGPGALPTAGVTISCSVYQLAVWTIPSSFSGLTSFQAVLTYTQQFGVTAPVAHTITLCFGLVASDCPPINNP